MKYTRGFPITTWPLQSIGSRSSCVRMTLNCSIFNLFSQIKMEKTHSHFYIMQMSINQALLEEFFNPGAYEINLCTYMNAWISWKWLVLDKLSMNTFNKTPFISNIINSLFNKSLEPTECGILVSNMVIKLVLTQRPEFKALWWAWL